MAQTQPGIGSTNSSPSSDSSSLSFNTHVAITVIVVIAVFLFMSIFLFFLRKRWALENMIFSFTEQQQAASVGVPNLNGLSIELVEKFPLIRYGSVKGTTAGKLGSTDCSVCLTEFEDDEKLRILPNCGHGFHADCIDMWLLSNCTCPLCRISLIPSSHDQIPMLADNSPPQAQPEDFVADARTIHDAQSVSQRRGSSRLVESLTLRALSRNSESFRKAAQDAERLCTGEVHESDGSTSSRRDKIHTTPNLSSEPYQHTSSSNTGGETEDRD